MIKKYFILLFLYTTLTTCLATTANAQTVIGMGTEQPNPNAVLELVPENGNQGFLAPRLTTAQRQASSFTGRLTRADHGLLVFDTNEGKFYYWFEGLWRAGTPGESAQAGAEVAGTTWYAGTTAPSGIDAAAGDFYINESTGEVFKFDGNAFASMGSLSEAPGSTPNLSTVLQQGGSAGNEKITDLGSPTQVNDAATKGYVDTELANAPALNPNLKAVLDQDNSAEDNKITNLAAPTDDKDAANKKYVDDRETATRTYVDNEIATLPPGGGTPSLNDVLTRDATSNDAGGNRITGLGTPTANNHAATKEYVDQEVATVSAGVTPSFEQVLIQSGNSAANRQIIDLAAPSAANHAANRKYVDDRDLENVLDRDNNAGGNQIINLGSPTADDHAANQKYVKDSAMISSFSVVGTNQLNITEGSASHTITLPPTGGTPATLTEDHFFIGNSANQPTEITFSGDISVASDGTVTITNITTAKIADGAVTKEKINADVAGPGLSKNATDGSLQVNAGGGLRIDGDVVKVTPFPNGWIGIGQGLGVDMDFKEVKRDATLNRDGELTVQGLRGRTIASTAPTNGQVLQWNGSSWVPGTMAGGSDRPGTWFSGNYVPSSTSPSGAVDGDFYFHTDDQTVYNRASGSWSAAGDLVSATLITPSTYTGGPAPDNSHPAKVGDFYIRNNGEVFLKVKGNGANQWVQID
jgi:hypothetical protein